MHEEDAGMLFKHWDYRANHAEVRRGRRLVLSFISTIANYEVRIALVQHPGSQSERRSKQLEPDLYDKASNLNGESCASRIAFDRDLTARMCLICSTPSSGTSTR